MQGGASHDGRSRFSTWVVTPPACAEEVAGVAREGENVVAIDGVVAEAAAVEEVIREGVVLAKGAVGEEVLRDGAAEVADGPVGAGEKPSE